MSDAGEWPAGQEFRFQSVSVQHEDAATGRGARTRPGPASRVQPAPAGVPNAGAAMPGKIVAPDLQLSPHTGKLGAPSSNTQQRPPANPPAGPPKNIPLGPNLRAMPVMQALRLTSATRPVQSLPPSARNGVDQLNHRTAAPAAGRRAESRTAPAAGSGASRAAPAAP